MCNYGECMCESGYAGIYIYKEESSLMRGVWACYILCAVCFYVIR